MKWERRLEQLLPQNPEVDLTSLRRLRRLRLGLIGFYCTVVVSSLSALAWALYISRADAITAATNQITSLAMTLDENVARSLDASRQAAQTISQHPKFLADLAHRDEPSLHKDLVPRLKMVQHMRSWNVIEPDGNVLVSTFKSPPPKVNASKRPYFAEVQKTEDIWVDPPVKSLIGGDWIIPMAQAIRDPDGSFRGVLMGTYSPEYLKKFYASIVADQQLIIMIARADGKILMRHPFIDEGMGVDISNSSVWKELASPSNNVVIGSDPFDKVVRHYVHRTVSNASLQVIVGVSENAILQRWWRDAKIKSGYVLCILMITCILSLFLLRQIKNLSRSEHDRRTLANYDSLTGLPNRSLLHSRIESSIHIAQRQEFMLAVLVLDLDNFKNLNDSCGHSEGDQLLRQVAERLRLHTRKTDLLARLGGDEFAILLMGVASPIDAKSVATTIQNQLSAPFHLKHGEFTTSVCVGISLYPTDGNNTESLLRNADTAMHQAKALGPNHCQFYLADMNDRLTERLSMESNLRRAIAGKEFILHYQAQISFETGRLMGAEALVRWQSPTGLIPPMKFIPIAEDSRLIIPLGAWVIDEACRQIREWLDQGLPMIRIAVNVSPLQFHQFDFLDSIKTPLEKYRIPSESLEIEITESVMATDIERVIKMMSELKSLGVKLSIDDFGTGYSSLSYLKRFEVDKLKIDQSFVRGLGADRNDEAIALAIIKLAQTLGLQVLAEGVETEQQLDFLQRNECNQFQGYLAQRPEPAAAFALLLEKSREPEFKVLTTLLPQPRSGSTTLKGLTPAAANWG